jgi:hypothetical protein
MAEDKIKLSYFVATPELRIDAKVTAYQGDMETAFQPGGTVIRGI